MDNANETNPPLRTPQTVEVSVANLDHLGLDAAAQRRIVRALNAAIEQELHARPESEVAGYIARPSGAVSFTIKQTTVQDSIGEEVL